MIIILEKSTLKYFVKLWHISAVRPQNLFMILMKSTVLSENFGKGLAHECRVPSTVLLLLADPILQHTGKYDDVILRRRVIL